MGLIINYLLYVYILYILCVSLLTNTMERSHNLKLGTFNCKGHGLDRVEYIKRLMGICDILFIQEHWYLESNLHTLESQIGDVNVIGVSGMEENQLLQGRPYGGCAFVYNKTLNCTVKPVITKSKRLCACVVTLPTKEKLLLFNAYMPCDTVNDTNNVDAFKDVLNEVTLLTLTHSDIEHVVFGGDLNTDLSRQASLHTEALHQFCESECLQFCLLDDHSKIDYTYENSFSGTYSILDHFVLSECLSSCVTKYICVHEGDNLSDHSPVLLDLNVTVENVMSPRAQAAYKPAWNCSTDMQVDQYKMLVKNLLGKVSIPYEAIACTDLECTQHFDCINKYHDDILNTCIEAANQCIPVKRKKSKAGWSDIVAPYKEKSIFWHNMWVENGKPRTGVVSDIMLKAKLEYKRISRWVIRNQDKLSADRMASALLNNNNHEFWSEVKRKACKSHNSPNIVDNAQGDSAIGDMFSQKYRDLYNCVSYNENEMDELLQEMSDSVSTQCQSGNCYCDHVITVDDVKDAVGKLKSDKADANEDVRSDHIINGSDELYVHISLLFSSMLSHSTAPIEMLLSALVPIPKDRKKSTNDSGNYRSIALSSILGKVLDNIVLRKHVSVLQTNDLQFGFKPKHSTTQCTFVLQEVIDYYVNHNSSCYVILLDASKAFDRIQYIKLFKTLLQRGMCPATAKLLLCMYNNQSLVVKWNQIISEPFRCSNGIKQGGVLSPVLFCVYMDELLNRLSRAKLGCYIGHHYMGAFCYADDLTLLAPSCNAAKKMLSICEKYANEFDVKFNSSKSVLLLYNVQNKDHIQLKLNGECLIQGEKAQHLGSFIGVDHNLSNRVNISNAANGLCYRTNVLLSRFSHCSTDVKCSLFDLYCTSYYGCPLWKLDKSALDCFCISWRKCIRRVLNLDRRTRSRYLPLLINKTDIRIQLLSRFCAFWIKCYTSKNPIVKFCARISIQSMSVVADNVRQVLSYLLWDYDTLLNHVRKGRSVPHYIKRLFFTKCNAVDASNAAVIKELCMQRDRTYVGPLQPQEVDDLLLFMCTA